MGNFSRCLRPWAAKGRNHAVPAFGDALFGVQSCNDDLEMPGPIKDGASAGSDLWGDFGCAWHCPACLEQLHRDPLTLASAWLRAVVADSAQVVPRIADTAVYVTAGRVLYAVCGVVVAKGGVVAGSSTSSSSSYSAAPPLEALGLTTPCTGAAWKSSETPSVAPLYSDVLRLLEDAWRKAADPRRCRPFLRLWSGTLLQVKFVVELCFAEAFAPAPHPARLSALAIRVIAALEVHDPAYLWAALQFLGDPEHRASVVGPFGDGTESAAACVMLQLQGYTALLLNSRRTLEACGCSVDEALRRMTTASDALVATSPGEVCWLGTWQLVHCADRAFRHVCHQDIGGSNLSSRASSDVLAMQNWAVRSVESAAVWHCGDPYAAIVAIFAVRTLILWRGLVLQQQEQVGVQSIRRSLRQTKGPPELLKSLERALASVSAHCVAAMGAGGDAAAEARAVSMLLNDHHLAGAPQLAAQQPCLLHAKRNSLQDSGSATRSPASLNVGQANANARSGPKQHVLSELGNAAGSAASKSVPMGFLEEDRREAVRNAMGLHGTTKHTHPDGFSDRASSPRLAPQGARASSRSDGGSGADAAVKTSLPADGAAFCALLDGPTSTPKGSREPTPRGSREPTPTPTPRDNLQADVVATMPAAEEVATSSLTDVSASGAEPGASAAEAMADAVFSDGASSIQTRPLATRLDSIGTSSLLLSAEVELAAPQAGFAEQKDKDEVPKMLHSLDAVSHVSSDPAPIKMTRGFAAAHHASPPSAPMMMHSIAESSTAVSATAGSSDATASDITLGITPASDAAAMPADGDAFERMCSEIVARNEADM